MDITIRKKLLDMIIDDSNDISMDYMINISSYMRKINELLSYIVYTDYREIIDNVIFNNKVDEVLDMGVTIFNDFIIKMVDTSIKNNIEGRQILFKLTCIICNNDTRTPRLQNTELDWIFNIFDSIMVSAMSSYDLCRTHNVSSKYVENVSEKMRHMIELAKESSDYDLIKTMVDQLDTNNESAVLYYLVDLASSITTTLIEGRNI